MKDTVSSGKDTYFFSSYSFLIGKRDLSFPN